LNGQCKNVDDFKNNNYYFNETDEMITDR